MNPGDGFIIFSGGGGRPKIWNPPIADPEQFPRHAAISDDECIERIAQIERLLERSKELRDKVIEIQEEINIISADMDAQKARLFPRLRKKNEKVCEGYGYGWRKWNERYYVVGWDEETIAKFNQPGGEQPGHTHEPEGDE